MPSHPALVFSDYTTLGTKQCVHEAYRSQSKSQQKVREAVSRARTPKPSGTIILTAPP